MEEKDLIIKKLMKEIIALRKLVEQQSLRISELERRLNKNSNNSSKPPSSDGLSKPPRTNSLRQKGKNKSGGQPGHKGETLKQTQAPDNIEWHKVLQCPSCLASLELIDSLGVLKRQVFDIPLPKLMVTEHQAEIKVCSCCNKRVVATFPYGVNAPVQYGEVIQSWAVYFQHQQFIPDHLRELKALIDYDKESWAIKMRRFLRFGLHCRHVYENKLIPDETLKRLTHLYPKIIAEGIAFHEGLPAFSEKNGRGRKARRTGHNLVLRLKNYCDDVLRFLFDPLVPFTNNQAERDIRMMKCKQKISGGFRSEKGAKIFARIRGFISTARKQGWNIFDSIQRVVRGSVPMPI